MVGNVAINPYINPMYQARLGGAKSPSTYSQGRSVDKNNDFGVFVQTGQIQGGRNLYGLGGSVIFSARGVTNASREVFLTQKSIHDRQAGNTGQMSTNALWNSYSGNTSNVSLSDIHSTYESTRNSYAQLRGGTSSSDNSPSTLWSAFYDRHSQNTTNNNLGNLQDVRFGYAQQIGMSISANDSDVLSSKGADMLSQNAKVSASIQNDFDSLKATRAEIDNKGLWNIRKNFAQDSPIQKAANGLLNNPNVHLANKFVSLEGKVICFYQNSEGENVGRILYDENGNILSVDYFEDKDTFHVEDLSMDGNVDYVKTHIENKGDTESSKKNDTGTKKYWLRETKK